MGQLIIKHLKSVFLRNRLYLVSVDGKEQGTLTFGNDQLQVSLAEGDHLVVITAGTYSISETVYIDKQAKILHIYPTVSQKIINILLTGIAGIVLAMLFLFLKDDQLPVRLLMLVILLPLCFVLVTTRKGHAGTFMIVKG